MILGQWRDAGEDEAHIAWARACHEAMHPWASAAVYSNTLSDGEGGRVRDAYGANYERLAAIKARYDGANLFRMNQNIVPVAAAM